MVSIVQFFGFRHFGLMLESDCFGQIGLFLDSGLFKLRRDLLQN